MVAADCLSVAYAAPVTFYELLRKLIEARPWSDQDRGDALTLIADMERLNVFGTLAGTMREQDHACQGGPWFPESRSCQVCGKPVEPPPHACVPKEFEGSAWRFGQTVQTTTKCAICGKAME